ncbi:MAG: hypothetical protein RIC35_19245 [Marinoscillum sp.]
MAVNLIEYASAPVLITAVYAGFIHHRLVTEMRILSYFIFLSAVIELVSKVMWYQGENNLPLLHLYVLIGFILLAMFYRSILQGFIPPKLISAVIAGFTLFTIINSAFIEPLTTFNSLALTVQSVLMIILCVFTFLVLMNDIVREKRQDLLSSLNWINSGLFLYYLSSLMVFYLGDQFIQYYSALTNQYLWSMHSFFAMIMYICLIVGLWKSPTRLNS